MGLVKTLWKEEHTTHENSNEMELELKNIMQQKGKKIKRLTKFLECIFIVGG